MKTSRMLVIAFSATVLGVMTLGCYSDPGTGGKGQPNASVFQPGPETTPGGEGGTAGGAVPKPASGVIVTRGGTVMPHTDAPSGGLSGGSANRAGNNGPGTPGE